MPLPAARCEGPADAKPARLRRLLDADRCGACENLWPQADLLPLQAQLREMVAAFERELANSMPPPRPGRLPLAITARRLEP